MRKAYVNWQDIFRIAGSSLTFRQYLDKMVEAGITPNQIGNGRDQYNLSRYGDVGVYSDETCRFTKRIENEREQHQRRSVTFYSYVCGHCGTAFFSVARDRVFCSRRCGVLFNRPWLKAA